MKKADLISMKMWEDGTTGKSKIRKYNVAILHSLGFKPYNRMSLTGVLHIEDRKTYTLLVFGVRSAIKSGVNYKYFGLAKKYKDRERAIAAFHKTLVQRLKKKKTAEI